MTLRHCSDLSAADWITTSDLSWETLVAFGPPGFPAYARLRLLPDPEYDGQSENEVEIEAEAPSDSARLSAAVQVLRSHTSTPEDCYFCLWDGWGSAPFADSVLQGPKVVVPNRAYFLFHGALLDLGDRGAAGFGSGQPGSHLPDPAFIWPADHAWCIANDVDPHWIGIGAATPAIDQLLAHPALDVVPADPRENQPYYL